MRWMTGHHKGMMALEAADTYTGSSSGVPAPGVRPTPVTVVTPRPPRPVSFSEPTRVETTYATPFEFTPVAIKSYAPLPKTGVQQAAEVFSSFFAVKQPEVAMVPIAVTAAERRQQAEDAAWQKKITKELTDWEVSTQVNEETKLTADDVQATRSSSGEYTTSSVDRLAARLEKKMIPALTRLAEQLKPSSVPIPSSFQIKALVYMLASGAGANSYTLSESAGLSSAEKEQLMLGLGARVNEFLANKTLEEVNKRLASASIPAEYVPMLTLIRRDKESRMRANPLAPVETQDQAVAQELVRAVTTAPESAYVGQTEVERGVVVPVAPSVEEAVAHELTPAVAPVSPEQGAVESLNKLQRLAQAAQNLVAPVVPAAPVDDSARQAVKKAIQNLRRVESQEGLNTGTYSSDPAQVAFEAGISEAQVRAVMSSRHK